MKQIFVLTLCAVALKMTLNPALASATIVPGYLCTSEKRVTIPGGEISALTVLIKEISQSRATVLVQVGTSIPDVYDSGVETIFVKGRDASILTSPHVIGIYTDVSVRTDKDITRKTMLKANISLDKSLTRSVGQQLAESGATIGADQLVDTKIRLNCSWPIKY